SLCWSRATRTPWPVYLSYLLCSLHNHQVLPIINLLIYAFLAASLLRPVGRTFGPFDTYNFPK
ncbi:MAG: hypothetical protein ACLFMQ_04810, partial [Desulfohalobiaceae bacterium]